MISTWHSNSTSDRKQHWSEICLILSWSDIPVVSCYTVHDMRLVFTDATDLGKQPPKPQHTQVLRHPHLNLHHFPSTVHPCSIHFPSIILDHHLSCDLQRPFACQCFLLDRLHQRNGSTGTIELQRQVHLKADAFTATATDVQRQHGGSCSCSHRSETGGVEHEPQNLIRNMTNLPKVEKKHHYTHYTMTYENLWAIECM